MTPLFSQKLRSLLELHGTPSDDLEALVPHYVAACEDIPVTAFFSACAELERTWTLGRRPKPGDIRDAANRLQQRENERGDDRKRTDQQDLARERARVERQVGSGERRYYVELVVNGVRGEVGLPPYEIPHDWPCCTVASLVEEWQSKWSAARSEYRQLIETNPSLADVLGGALGLRSAVPARQEASDDVPF